MRRTSGCAVIAMAVAALSVGARDQLPAPPAAEKTAPAAAASQQKSDAAIEQLIKDLGSDDYRTREKAGRDLVARGEKILPELRAALAATENPEVHRRLLVMVRKMDYERLVAPKLVTMNLKDKTVKEAFAEIGKQTGYKIDYNGNGRGTEPKQTFTFENAPFWEVVDKVAGAAGCSVFNDFNNEEGTIQVFNQDALNPYVAYAGPFRILATNISSNKNLQLSGINRRHVGVNRQDFLNLNFQILSEPKNPMLGILQVDVISATDDLGGSLLPPRDPNNRVNYYNNGVQRGHNMYGGMNLSRADKAATSIKSLKAKAGVILLSGTVPEIVVSDPLKVKNKTFTGRTMEIDFGSFTEDANNKGHYSLELTAKKLIPGDPNRGDDFNWMNSIWQKIEVTDAAGVRYQSSGPTNFNNNGATVQLTMQFGPQDRRTGQAIKLAPPTKVLVNEWQSVVHEVTFEFKDVPLP